MLESPDMPNDVPGCRAFIQTQANTIATQGRMIEEQGRTIEGQGLEMEKIRKLLSQLVNGQRSEKRIISGPNQNWLPFESSEEFQAARAEAEAQAEAVIQKYTVEREVQKKKPRDAAAVGTAIGAASCQWVDGWSLLRGRERVGQHVLLLGEASRGAFSQASNRSGGEGVGGKAPAGSADYCTRPARERRSGALSLECSRRGVGACGLLGSDPLPGELRPVLAAGAQRCIP